jgi:hypothetical protein
MGGGSQVLMTICMTSDLMTLRVHAANDIRKAGGRIIDFSLAAIVGRDEKSCLYTSGLERV